MLAGGRRRIVEVGTAYGFSTLWLALGQPSDGSIVTIDPDTERTDLARGWWRQAGIPDEFTLVVAHERLKTKCRVIWRNPARLGVEFLAESSVPDVAAAERQPA